MDSVEELGEHKIIDIILKCLEPMPNMPVAFGDDVSAVDIVQGKLAIIKTDMLVGKTDVPPDMSLWQAARKTVVMNISDLAAKGVKPTALLASIGVPRSFAREDIEQIGKGLNAGAREFGAYILGGDTNETSDLVISCVAFGVGDKKRIMLRSGARPGDVVAVSGVFGKTAAGLKILLQHLSVSPRLKNTLVDAVLMPRVRLKEGLALAQVGAVTASIDSSDGLAWSLHEISKASKVGFIINHLPVAYEARQFAETHGLDPVELCLYGGEEYELVVTVKPELWEKAKRAVSLIKIGLVTKERKLLLEEKGKKIPIEPRGWEHFKTNIGLLSS
ncbi:MAG: thiamine-phosphate kinase [Candidatus Bathyarchaeota archaeon]|nr:thiamine-phosphate kinase [Candidatus Bathyarchaeota archaeon]